MHPQRICAPAFSRARARASFDKPASPAALNAARRALGAGPLWGRPAAAALLSVHAAALLLLLKSGVIGSVPVLLLAGSGTVIVLATAIAWCRGIDVNAWLQAEPRHRRGSCQWLIWRGEYSGMPCLACLASMPARERRTWLQAASSPAVVAGWLTESGHSRPAVRDAGAVRAGWLAWQLLPAGCLLAAVVNWTAGTPTGARLALPLALAAALTATVNLFLRSGGARHPAAGAEDGAVTRVCESCHRMPGTVTVRFPDEATFSVCAGCLAAGVHAPSVAATSAEVAR